MQHNGGTVGQKAYNQTTGAQAQEAVCYALRAAYEAMDIENDMFTSLNNFAAGAPGGSSNITALGVFHWSAAGQSRTASAAADTVALYNAMGCQWLTGPLP